MVKRNNTVVISSLEIKRIKSYINKCNKQILEATFLNNLDFCSVEDYKQNEIIVLKALATAKIF